MHEVILEYGGPAFLQNTLVLDASDSSHSSTLLKGLYSFYKEHKYCVITLKTSDEQKIQVHRVTELMDAFAFENSQF